jgi:hypothetical protein
MKRVYLSIFFACIFAIGVQAQASDPPTTAGNVIRVVYFDVMPGKTNEFLTFLRKNSKVIFEEQMKQGLILNYMYYSKPTSEGPGDWDVALTVSYRTYADAIDFNAERGAKFDAITLKHYGTAEERTKANNYVDTLRTVVSTHLIREQKLNPMK